MKQVLKGMATLASVNRRIGSKQSIVEEEKTKLEDKKRRVEEEKRGEEKKCLEGFKKTCEELNEKLLKRKEIINQLSLTKKELSSEIEQLEKALYYSYEEYSMLSARTFLEEFAREVAEKHSVKPCNFERPSFNKQYVKNIKHKDNINNNANAKNKDDNNKEFVSELNYSYSLTRLEIDNKLTNKL